jgi:hypothetical protein
MQLNDLPVKYRQQAEAQIGRRVASQVPDPQRPHERKPVAAETDAGSDRPVMLRVVHFRKRLADYDDLCAKYVVDALVDRGVLAGDSPKHIRGVVHEQVKVKTGSEEKTVIEVYE